MPSTTFKPTTEVSIQAPPTVVFGLLRDRSTWKQWNPFVPRAELVRSAPGEDANPDQLQVGQRLRFFVQVEPRGKPRILPLGTVEEVVRLDLPDPVDEHAIWRVNWSQRMLPAFLLRTIRVNEVLMDEPAGTGCIYRTSMVFEGLLVGIVRLVAGAMVQRGLERWAAGLKDAAERHENH